MLPLIAVVWVALLLLLSTLSSNPLGSREQSAPGPGERFAHASALPLGRALDEAAVAPAHPDPLPRPHDLQPVAPGAPPASAGLVLRLAAPSPLPAVDDPIRSLLERLPYFATPPPDRRSI